LVARASLRFFNATLLEEVKFIYIFSNKSESET
jgi:hypothetical protein